MRSSPVLGIVLLVVTALLAVSYTHIKAFFGGFGVPFPAAAFLILTLITACAVCGITLLHKGSGSPPAS